MSLKFPSKAYTTNRLDWLTLSVKTQVINQSINQSMTSCSSVQEHSDKQRHFLEQALKKNWEQAIFFLSTDFYQIPNEVFDGSTSVALDEKWIRCPDDWFPELKGSAYKIAKLNLLALLSKCLKSKSVSFSAKCITCIFY